MGEIKVSSAKGVMTLVLADEANRNALGGKLIQGMRDSIAAANADPVIRAVVVTNEGSTFCAGANLKERSASPGDASSMGSFESLLLEIQQSPTPIVGRIAGHVVGGGNGLAAAMDISIAAEEAKFGFTEVRLGLSPAIISVVCLPKMRPGEAMEVFLRGHRFPAKRAAELGLINRAVPVQELDQAVEEVITDLRKGGPNALAVSKRLVYEVPKMEKAEAFRWASKQSAALFSSEEGAEGMAAFLGKRRAKWASEE